MKTFAWICLVFTFCVVGCGQKNGDPAPHGLDKATPMPALSPRGSGQVQDSSQIDDTPTASSFQYIGVVDLHGLLRPIIQRTAKEGWITAWPTPTGEDSVAPGPSLRVPREWRCIPLESTNAVVSIRLRWMSAFSAFCGHDWAYVTDRTGLYPVYDDGIGRAAGFAFSRGLGSLGLVSDAAAILRADRVRQSLGLWSNKEQGERYYRFDLCGYFLVNGKMLGLGVSRAPDGESYVMFEVDSDRGRVVLKVPGGGC
jgi:hypothetical protein